MILDDYLHHNPFIAQATGSHSVLGLLAMDRLVIEIKPTFLTDLDLQPLEKRNRSNRPSLTGPSNTLKSDPGSATRNVFESFDVIF